MPRVCTVCVHPQRGAIDQALVTGESVRSLASRYVPLSKTALSRHAEHIPGSLVKAQEETDVRNAIDVVKQLRAINSTCKDILEDARQRKDDDTALKAVDRIYRQLELQAKLLGELNEAPQVNLFLTPEWGRACAVLLRALGPYPEARAAGAAALIELEGR